MTVFSGVKRKKLFFDDIPVYRYSGKFWCVAWETYRQSFGYCKIALMSFMYFIWDLLTGYGPYGQFTGPSKHICLYYIKFSRFSKCTGIQSVLYVFNGYFFKTIYTYSEWKTFIFYIIVYIWPQRALCIMVSLCSVHRDLWHETWKEAEINI